MNHLVSSAGKDEDAAASMAAADTDSDPDRLWTRAVAITSSLTIPDYWKCLGWRNSLCTENTFLERGNAHNMLTLGTCVPLG